VIRVFGYLDASSGSMLVGAVAAGAAGVAVAAKVGWRRVTGVFSRKGDDLESAETADTTADVVEPGEPATDAS
jgi:hypothetical protein